VSSLHLRTDPAQPVPEGGLLLDWFGHGGASTVSGSLLDLTRNLNSPSSLALDLMRLGVAVYCADKAVLRDVQRDHWTRNLRLHIPVSDVERWRGAAPSFEEALAFLTNDRWELRFRRLDTEGAGNLLPPAADTVCLFSGGLDSLAGAIDLLEQGRSVMLVGHYDSNLLRPRQQHLFEQLQRSYGTDRVWYRPFYLRLASVSAAQARPLPPGREPTTRSRSFLFIAAAGLVASALGIESVTMPENGYIGLNIPLEPSRLGACSTRTTHPHFLRLLADAFALVDGPEISNPYQLQTKGEVLHESRDAALLLQLAPASISCAHPEVGRWGGAGYGNCGYCYPCLMRRVALHGVGADDPAAYRVNAVDRNFVQDGGTRAGHIRALIDSIHRQSRPSDVLRSGPLPRGRVREFSSLYERGRAEVAAWLAPSMPA
jgi:7-cyano-7-deazaguanine synthase in queuosine biosynthesis